MRRLPGEIRTRFNNDNGYSHHQSLEALAESASQSCSLCEILLLGIRKEFDRRSNPRVPTSRCRLSSSYSGNVTQIPGLLLEIDSKIYAEFGIYTQGDVLDPLKDIIPGRRTETCPAGAASLHKIQHWLETCVTRHPQCTNNDYVDLPTRVIDVSKARPELYISGGTKGKYVALSHCWGNAMSFTSTMSTLVERTRGIDMAHLPRTFQDAIEMTRKLDIPYLWIDSLCIIQDDPDDWNREAARMLDVYRNSFLTVAALSATNCHEGFLHDRTVPVRVSCEVPFSCPEQKLHGSVSVYWPSSKIGNDVLSTRGWTLQELILPSRILQFSDEQMIWDCEQQEREDGLTPTIAGYGATRIRARLRSSSSVTSSPYLQWYALVENYSSRKVTVEADKLPAISGLAQQIQNMTNDVYLAGLWERDVVSGLMWTPSQNQKLKRVLSPYRGPSWSWSAVDGAISYHAVLHRTGQDFELDVTKAVAVPSNNNKVGAVAHAYINVSCFLKETVAGRRNIYGLYDFGKGAGEYLPDDGQNATGATIWCMRVLSKPYGGDSTTQIHPHGLVLQPTGDPAKMEFQRIGTFRLQPGINWFTGGEDWFEGCEKVNLTII